MMHATNKPLKRAIPGDCPGPVLPPRRQLLRALLRHGRPSGASSLSVSKLGSRRWHIRTSDGNAETQSEIYLSPDEGSLLHAVLTNRRLEILIEGELGENTTQNLGDCLIRAMACDVRHIVISVEKMETVCPESLGLLESFARHLACDDVGRIVEIRGKGAAERELAQAFARGFSRFRKIKGRV